MPSAFILAVRSYPALPRAGQLAHQRYVPPNPLVLGRKLLKSPTPTTDRDRPVSRRSKPSSRTAFIGEQPNPWELLHPQDAMSRHRRIMHRHGSCIASRENCQLQILRNKSRRVASVEETEASPFGSVVTGSSMKDGHFHRDFPRYCRVDLANIPFAICNWEICNFTFHGRVHRYKPTCWYGLAAAAPRCVKVPNLLAAVNAQRR